MRELVFWQDSLSIHQATLLRHLAARPELKVMLVTAEGVNAARARIGWKRPDFGETEIISDATPAVRSRLIGRDLPGAVHIFSGPRADPMVRDALLRALRSNAWIGLYSEAHDDRGVKGGLRLLRGRYDAGSLAHRTDFILAIGQTGVDWFTRCGYPQQRIFPFGYFVDDPRRANAADQDAARPHQEFALLFVGQIIARKGWDILLRALYGVRDLNWRLHVVGDGADAARFVALAEKLKLAGAIHMWGTLANPAVIDVMRRCDLLVLPSRWDGWGAVVNEALMCGLPVVCSDRCGAACLLDGGERGAVFPAFSVAHLRAALASRMAAGKTGPDRRERIRAWAGCIGGAVAADYLMQVIAATEGAAGRPAAPWLSDSQV